MNQNLILPGMKKLASDLGVVPAVLRPVARTAPRWWLPAAAWTSMADGDVKDKIFLPGYDTPRKSREEEKAAQTAREEVWKEEATFYGLPEKQQRDYFRARAEQIRNWVRSAELESPAPRGHYLREFGQSDQRDLENANHEASVPQALAMMNGQLMPESCTATASSC